MKDDHAGNRDPWNYHRRSPRKRVLAEVEIVNDPIPDALLSKGLSVEDVLARRSQPHAPGPNGLYPAAKVVLRGLDIDDLVHFAQVTKDPIWILVARAAAAMDCACNRTPRHADRSIPLHDRLAELQILDDLASVLLDGKRLRVVDDLAASKFETMRTDPGDFTSIVILDRLDVAAIAEIEHPSKFVPRKGLVDFDGDFFCRGDEGAWLGHGEDSTLPWTVRARTSSRVA